MEVQDGNLLLGITVAARGPFDNYFEALALVLLLEKCLEAGNVLQ